MWTIFHDFKRSISTRNKTPHLIPSVLLKKNVELLKKFADVLMYHHSFTSVILIPNERNDIQEASPQTVCVFLWVDLLNNPRLYRLRIEFVLHIFCNTNWKLNVCVCWDWWTACSAFSVSNTHLWVWALFKNSLGGRICILKPELDRILPCKPWGEPLSCDAFNKHTKHK